MDHVWYLAVVGRIAKHRMPERLKRRLHTANRSIKPANLLCGRWFVEMDNHSGNYSTSQSRAIRLFKKPTL